MLRQTTHLTKRIPSLLSISRTLPRITPFLPHKPISITTRPFTASLPRFAPALGTELSAGDSDFQKIIDEAGDTPVVVDFYANWCGPCKVLAPVLKKVVEQNGKTFLVKVDVDAAESTAAKYQIMSLPTVAIIRNGKVTDSFIGTRDEAAVRKFVEKATEKSA